MTTYPYSKPVFGYSTETEASLFKALGPFEMRTSGPIAIDAITANVSPFPVTKKKTGDDELHFVLQPSDDWLESTYATMLASEKVLSREWNTPEEDEAWDDL